MKGHYRSAERVGKLLGEAHMTLAVAESCTGGMLGSWLTEVPGSSRYFLGGVISYADALKESLLGVPRATVRGAGAVSAETALAMAQGVRALAGADLGVSITGVAGPDGGSDAKPVGTTYVGMAGPGLERIEKTVWAGDRMSNREQSALLALQMIINYLEGITKEE